MYCSTYAHVHVYMLRGADGTCMYYRKQSNALYYIQAITGIYLTWNTCKNINVLRPFLTVQAIPGLIDVTLYNIYNK